jgi:hypothetical protein
MSPVAWCAVAAAGSPMDRAVCSGLVSGMARRLVSLKELFLKLLTIIKKPHPYFKINILSTGVLYINF